MATGSLKVHFLAFALKAFFSFPMDWDGMGWRGIIFTLTSPLFIMACTIQCGRGVCKKTTTTTVEVYTLMLLQSGSEGEEET
jgi:hypothetical protein